MGQEGGGSDRGIGGQEGFHYHPHLNLPPYPFDSLTNICCLSYTGSGCSFCCLVPVLVIPWNTTCPLSQFACLPHPLPPPLPPSLYTFPLPATFLDPLPAYLPLLPSLPACHLVGVAPCPACHLVPHPFPVSCPCLAPTFPTPLPCPLLGLPALPPSFVAWAAALAAPSAPCLGILTPLHAYPTLPCPSPTPLYLCPCIMIGWFGTAAAPVALIYLTTPVSLPTPQFTYRLHSPFPCLPGPMPYYTTLCTPLPSPLPTGTLVLPLPLPVIYPFPLPHSLVLLPSSPYPVDSLPYPTQFPCLPLPSTTTHVLFPPFDTCALLVYTYYFPYTYPLPPSLPHLPSLDGSP